VPSAVPADSMPLPGGSSAVGGGSDPMSAMDGMSRMSSKLA